MRSLEQERAANALARVNKLRERTDGFKERYRSYVDRLGPAIVMNGLGQALATERAAAGTDGTTGTDPKKDDELELAHHEIYRSLQQWLCRNEGGVYPSSDDLLEAIMENDEVLYLRAQVEALSWIEWHKKCCRASFPKGEGDDE